MLLRADSCEGPDAVQSSPTVCEWKCITVSERNMSGEWQHRPPGPAHSCQRCFALRLQYSRYAAIRACGAAGRITAPFQTTFLASLILPLPNSDLSVSEYTIVKTPTLLSDDAELKNAKGQHTKGHTEGLFPFKTRRV